MAKYSIFEHLKNLTENKEDWNPDNDDQVSSYNVYMINKYISMSEMYIPIVNEINQYNVPKDINYNYYYDVLPKRKQYFKYIKKTTGHELTDSQKSILYDYFQIGPKQVDQYIEIMTKEDLDEIFELYNDGRQ